MKFMERKDIKFPQLRLMLIDSLKDLSDRELQRREWISKTAAHRFWDTLRFDVAVIFDDLDLEDDLEGSIGYHILDQEEADVLRPLIVSLRAILNKIGREQPDAAYINSPLWDKVVASAQKAYAVFEANDLAYAKAHGIVIDASDEPKR